MKGRKNNNDIFAKECLSPLIAEFTPKTTNYPERICRICGKECDWQDPVTKDWYHQSCHVTIHRITKAEELAHIPKRTRNNWGKP